MKTKVTRTTIIEAIEKVNREHGYKIELNRDEQTGKWFNFTLKTKSGISGARTSHSGRNLPSASWHAHGYIFDEIWAIDPSCVIYSNGVKMSGPRDNWQDKNIGSVYCPKMFSETSIL